MFAKLFWLQADLGNKSKIESIMNILESEEMTMRLGKMDNQLSTIVNQNKESWKTGSHIGDIEDKKVLLYKATDKNLIYSLWKDDEFVGYSLVIDANPIEISQAWIDPEYRKQRIFSKILWFLKTRMNYSPIQLGDIHNRDTVEVLKNLSRFKKYWWNGRDKIPYDPDSINQFYSLEKPTHWKLLLENDGDFSSWPKYTTGYMIKDFYDWQIE